MTSLMSASRSGQVDIVRLLLEHGASVDATDGVSQPGCLAAPPSTPHRGSRAQAAADAAWPGDVARRVEGQDNLAGCVHGVDVRRSGGEDRVPVEFSSQQDGMTSLMWASRSGHVDIVRLLLDRGANADATANVSDQGHVLISH
ncbi:unnamed protein product [Symbiodinium sp. KB8]|nr:unnamed protein product [Symbiodinium sp. KB8]